jgi:hypothetical protein
MSPSHFVARIVGFFHLCLVCFDRRDSSLPAVGSFSRRTNESPRFNSAVKSVSSVATCTGLPDSFPSQALSSSGVVSTYRPCRRTGIPSDAQRWTTEAGSPKRPRFAANPSESLAECVPLRVSSKVSALRSHANKCPCGAGSSSIGLAHSASSFWTWLRRVLTG